jgi:toxin-antitoxin system PIN domain toxin
MILVDANVLLYAYHPRSAQHDRCRDWVERAFIGPTPVWLAWATILAFIRISTSSRVFESPLRADEARRIVAAWLEAPAVGLLNPGERFWVILQDLLQTAQVAGPLVMDAAFAALALEHGAALCTTDRDFLLFPGLRLMDPTMS